MPATVSPPSRADVTISAVAIRDRLNRMHDDRLSLTLQKHGSDLAISSSMSYHVPIAVAIGAQIRVNPADRTPVR